MAEGYWFESRIIYQKGYTRPNCELSDPISLVARGKEA